MNAPVITNCRSCNAKIAWLYTVNSKKMPVNAESLAPEDDSLTEFDPKRHMNHFATCPQAKRWSKKNAAKPSRVEKPQMRPIRDTTGELPL